MFRFSILAGRRRPDSRRGARLAPPEAQARSRRWVRMVRIAARHHLYEMNCLRRALALRWLLALRGIPSELAIGVEKGDDGLAAHAWVEIDGAPLGEGDGERFLPLRRAGERQEAAGSALGAL